VIKALGGLSKGFRWREIEILSDPRGKPLVNLHGSMWDKAANLGLGDFAISLSDCEEYAVAFVVGDEKGR
jgi:holo-[acyl-carrier protein] synthase